MSDITDVASERAVLAGLFAYGADSYDDVADIVTARTFTDELNSSLFRCLEHCLQVESGPPARPDYPTLLSSARSLGLSEQLDSEESRRYIRAIMNFPVKQESVRRLAGKIRKLEIGRLLQAQLAQSSRNLQSISGDEPIDRILSLAEEPILDLTSLLTGQDSGPRKMGQGALDYIQWRMDNPCDRLGISTGLKQLDVAIGGGLRVNSVDVIAARPKTGKTWLVDMIALFIARGGIPVYNVDTEMTWEEHLNRILSILSGVPLQLVENGQAGRDARHRALLEDAARQLADMPYYYECVIGRNFEDLLASMRRWVSRTVGLDPDTGHARDCVIIYDYLKLMSADFTASNLQEYQALGFIATALKNFTGRYRLPCLCFAQLNRDGIDREDSGVISGSDRIIHYCTSLTIYKQKTEEERAECGAYQYSHKLVPILSRHGKGLKAGDYINIRADYAHGKIEEGPTRYGLSRNEMDTSGMAGMSL